MMERHWQLRVCTVLLAMNLAFIWGNSLMRAEISQGFSDWAFSFLNGVPVEKAASTGSGLLRKAAHFAEFASLGLLIGWRRMLLRKNTWMALPLGMAVASLDETIQFFVPGRAPGIRDVAIDTCGVFAGILLLQIGYTIIRRKQQ